MGALLKTARVKFLKHGTWVLCFKIYVFIVYVIESVEGKEVLSIK